MFNNPLPLIDRLDEMKDSEVTMLYNKVFNVPEGDLVLADLMDRFFEFKRTTNDHEAGSQAVLIYIKNRLLGIAEPDLPNTGDQQHESQR